MEDSTQQIGKYRIERHLGSGGFARVFLCWDPDLDKFVAVKVLADNYADNEDVRRRFLQEAKILSNLDHDRILRVHYVDELADGRPYFVAANGFADSIKEMLYKSEPPAFAVVLDCEQMTVMDMTGAMALKELATELRANDVEVYLARIHGDALAVARRSGALDEIGDANIHTTVAGAVNAALAATTGKKEN